MNNQIVQLEDLTSFLENTLHQRVKSLRTKKMKGATQEEKILSLLLTGCERGTDVSPVKESLLNRIAAYTVVGAPIQISLSVAIGCKIPNRLKFSDLSSVPTFAWVHLFWFFKVLNEKIKKVYSPGVEVIIFDESSLFRDLLFADHLSEEDIRKFYRYLSIITEYMKPPVRFIPMRPDMFDIHPAEIPPNEVPDCVTYAMVCSLPHMQDPRVMDPLYTTSRKDYTWLAKQAGEDVWQKAQLLAGKVHATLKRRKELGLFQKLTQSCNLIDACITRKDGRLCLNITVPCLFNHGVPILECDQKTGKYKVKMTPEYRIQRGDYGPLVPYYWALDGETVSLAYYQKT